MHKYWFSGNDKAVLFKYAFYDTNLQLFTYATLRRERVGLLALQAAKFLSLRREVDAKELRNRKEL